MKRTKEQYDRSFYKVIDTINSCTTLIHAVRTRQMIHNFQNLFEKSFEKTHNDWLLLQRLLDDKSTSIISSTTSKNF